MGDSQTPEADSDFNHQAVSPVILRKYSLSTSYLRSTSSLLAFMVLPYHNASDEESDTHSISSISTGFAPSKATSTTSINSDISMQSISRPPSVFSITSSIRALAYRQEYGRDLNNYSEIYRLPADEEELERLGEHIITTH